MSKNTKPINWRDSLSSQNNIEARESPLQRSVLTSGRSTVKRQRDYCSTIDLIPSGRDFRMEIYIDMFDSNQKFVKRKTVKQVFIDDACQTGKTCHCRFTNLALTSQLSTYRGGFECLAAGEETQLNIQF